ncbi:MAG TPA: MBOAT family O-acyltransferase [Elusimicrobiales bacterium]|nr:MBOAT family O-acyltransferase [Elusimicrobiales bacterium]
MLFNSIQFFIFFPAVAVLFFLLPHRFRWLLLLSASAIFYMAFVPKYILILLTLGVIDFWAAKLIARSTGRRRLVFLWVSIISTCAMLFVFKYFNFFVSNVNVLADFLGWNYRLQTLKLILPIGLSFHTFQSLSYVIEVYRGKQEVEPHFGIYFLYLIFFPQLVAGPIERPGNLLNQFRQEHYFDLPRIANGLKLILWGLFKKVVIADGLAGAVSVVYSNPSAFDGLGLALATTFFAFQIYCDFSGYSDIAIGAAQVLGFRLMTNFNRPYASQSVVEYWKRWHISLSSWFKDYLYIPLGGSRSGEWRWRFNIVVTFLISGVWHGANWTYVAWGLLNAFYLIIYSWTANARRQFAQMIGLDVRPGLLHCCRVGCTFFLIWIGGIFFRALTVSDAGLIIRNIFMPSMWRGLSGLQEVKSSLAAMGLEWSQFLLLVFFILVLELVQLVQRDEDMRHLFSAKPLWFQWSFAYALIFTIGIFWGSVQMPFVYFQF